MKFEKTKKLNNEKFRRLTGIKGRRHDFRVFKQSKIKFHVETHLITDGVDTKGLKNFMQEPKCLKEKPRGILQPKKINRTTNIWLDKEFSMKM